MKSSALEEMKMFRETEPRVLRAKAQAAVSGSKITGDILPRYVYELAEEPVPPGATDKLQKGTPPPEDKSLRGRLKRWWRRNWSSEVIFDD